MDIPQTEIDTSADSQRKKTGIFKRILRKIKRSKSDKSLPQSNEIMQIDGSQYVETKDNQVEVFGDQEKMFEENLLQIKSRQSNYQVYQGLPDEYCDAYQEFENEESIRYITIRENVSKNALKEIITQEIEEPLRETFDIGRLEQYQRMCKIKLMGN